MIACTPNSDSCSCSDGEGATGLCPAVPMKSPIKLISGFNSFAFELAPPNVWLAVDCIAFGSAPGAAATAAGSAFAAAALATDSADGSTPLTRVEDASSTRDSPVPGAPFVSTSAFICPRSKATSCARVLTCFSSDWMRTSESPGEFALATGTFFSSLSSSCPDSCACTGHDKKIPAITATNTFIDTPLANARYRNGLRDNGGTGS